MAAKKKPARGSKKRFILDLPGEMSAKDVVQRAKKAGISITSAHVYTVRAGQGLKARKKPAARGSRVLHGDADFAQRFVQASVNLGLLRSAELLAQLRARLHGV